jgi:parallel beta-helix repeat protein
MMKLFGAVMKKTALALPLILALLIPSVANAEFTRSYSSNDPEINYTHFLLTVYSPDNNQTCKSTMLLNFTVDWREYPTFAGLPSPPAPVMKGLYSYTIDNNTAVTVASNQSSTDQFDVRGFKVNPTFSYLLDVSNLTNGYHKIVITVGLTNNYDDIARYINKDTPIQFFVQNLTPTDPPIPEFSSIHIRADGSIGGTDKIQRDGNVYTFLGNISIDGSGIDGVIVEKDNIVIDGANYTLQLTGAMESSIGIKLADRTNVTIKNLRILNFNYGIQLRKSSNNTILRNYVYPIGILLRGAHNNIILENSLSGGDWGTGIMIDVFNNASNSSENHILGNHITNQEVGINSLMGSENIISGNNITNCKTYGIFLGGYPNNIIGNNFENNTVGIFFSEAASNNTIYDNNFINNEKDMDDAHSVAPWLYEISVNYWDNGSRGNYWSDYNGTDKDGDGIGDSPHFVYENNQDNYPLMNPVDVTTIPEFPSWIILPLLLTTTLAIMVCKRKLTENR